MTNHCSWPKLVTVVGLNYLFIPKKYSFIFIRPLVFCILKKLFGFFFYNYFIILFVKIIRVL
jgi:hypothetical protein